MRQDLSLTGRQLVSGEWRLDRPREPGDDLRIDDGSAGHDAAGGIGEIPQAATWSLRT
jgi:hypothetical protein